MRIIRPQCGKGFNSISWEDWGELEVSSICDYNISNHKFS
jgi:hypothetical protein